jgi:hypothetical protein
MSFDLIGYESYEEKYEAHNSVLFEAFDAKQDAFDFGVFGGFFGFDIRNDRPVFL